jgi:CheY-like chemotaxis protein
MTIVLPRTAAGSERAGTVLDDEWPGGDETVLLVDDDTEVRRATSKVLAAGGYTVVAATSGTEALALLAARPDIAAVVSDIVMPGMSGVDLAREVATARPDLPLLLISGSVFDENIASEWQLVRKPYTPIGLLRVLRDVLDRAAR